MRLSPATCCRTGAPRQHLEHDIREFTLDRYVEPSGALAGKSVADGGLRHLQGLYRIGVDRRGQTVVPVAPSLGSRTAIA